MTDLDYEGHYLVDFYSIDGSVTPVDPTQPDNPPVPAGSFLLTDNFGWGTAYVYAWDDNGNELYGEWPGANHAETRVNEYGETQFVCVVPEGATGVILNNGAGAQTEDITDFSYDGYWMDGTQNELGHYKVTGWNAGDNPVTPDPTEPDNPDPTTPDNPVPAGSFLLTDNFGWGTAYVYAWDDNGNELYGEWPGANQAETRVNEYGETQFVCVVPEGATGVILNNGAGAQTEDITDFSYDGYWMDGTQNELGHYKVTGWNAGDTPVTPDPTEPDTPDPTEPDNPVIGGEGGTIIFTNNKGFSTVNIYYWSDSSTPVEWPGVAMTSIGQNEYGEERFTFTMPEGMTNYIITDGSQQTVDIPFTGSTGVYMLDTTDAQGHYNVDFYEIDPDNPVTPVTPDPTEPDNPDEPITDEVTFLLTDNFGWGAAYVYAWDADGNAINGEWPGAAQAETVTNDYGETQFKCTVPAGAVGVILNNGNGAQTEDITDFGTYTGYWMDGSKNDLGHYKVTGWN